MEKRRRFGIPGVEEADWGEHICVLFNSKEELLNLTVPYIKAGLEDNEFCMWITGYPVSEPDAIRALEQVFPNVHQYVLNKQLEILPHTKWYFSAGVFNGERVLQNWLSQTRRAQENGFEGARVTGNPFWLVSEHDWEQFRVYEHLVSQRIRNERLLALCTYPKEICQIIHIMQILSTHGTTLLPRTGHWERHTIPEPYTKQPPSL